MSNSHSGDFEGAGGRRELTPWKVWKMIFFGLFVVLIGLVALSSSIVHKFGPYTGRVVDLENEKPIEGAAVLIVFYTKGPFSVSSYADAVEAVTDKNGEFRIPWQLAITFHPLSSWEPYGYVTIFRPGYGVYPDHDDVTPMFVPNGMIPKKHYVTFKLPELKTKEEQKKNLPGGPPSGEMPKKKVKHFLKLIAEERQAIGLKP